MGPIPGAKPTFPSSSHPMIPMIAVLESNLRSLRHSVRSMLPRAAARSTFTPGPVRIRDTAERLVWEGHLASLYRLPRELATRQILLVEESASHRVHTVTWIP